MNYNKLINDPSITLEQKLLLKIDLELQDWSANQTSSLKRFDKHKDTHSIETDYSHEEFTKSPSIKKSKNNSTSESTNTVHKNTVSSNSQRSNLEHKSLEGQHEVFFNSIASYGLSIEELESISMSQLSNNNLVKSEKIGENDAEIDSENDIIIEEFVGPNILIMTYNQVQEGFEFKFF